MELKKHLRPFLRYLAVFSVPVVCMATLLLYNNVMSGYRAAQQEALSQLAQAGAQLGWPSARAAAPSKSRPARNLPCCATCSSTTGTAI